ncbi:hypothetical protein WEB32_33970 [Streptomyces netropsis]|uniref:hypothetical protein n=1 Tax=Streptomyces netropsis TaxID=55404 RepID=UPI0030CC91BA
MSDNHRDLYPSLRGLDALPIPAGAARQRQLGMVRQELATALDNGMLPITARCNLQHLLDETTLRTYIQVAETGALRSRLVNGGKPPTAAATNAARLDCLDLIREVAGLSPLFREARAPVELHPPPGNEQLNTLRRRLSEEVGRTRSPGHARFIAVVAMVLDTRARSGELVAQRVSHLDDSRSSIHMARSPQHGTNSQPVSEAIALSSVSRAALAQWLPIRTKLTEPLQGSATALWVSISHNHAGATNCDGQSILRIPGMPLQQRGLIRSYNNGRHQYGFTHLLPPKLEQLRRALEGNLALSCAPTTVTEPFSS